MSDANEVYQGRFGRWSVEKEDVAEVWGYRAGISVTCAAALLASSLAFLPDNQDTEAFRTIVVSNLDWICLAGSAGLGVSLQLIHIYIAPLKRALQALWLAGTLGGVYLMANNDSPAALVVAQQPWTVWLVGPLFASLTGVAFKEGFCYNKWEAAGLFGTIPLLMLGHLSGLVNDQGQLGMLAAMNIMLFVFAARKYTQPIKDDIGDKSVFTFMAASPEKQRAILAALGEAGDMD